MKKRFFIVLASFAFISACASSQTPPQAFDEFTQDRVYFPFDSADLTPAAQTVLGQQASWLCGHPRKKVILEGYADPRGSQKYNLELSARRAEAVKDFFIAEGIKERRITLIPYGMKNRASNENNIKAWALDRRVITVPTDD